MSEAQQLRCGVSRFDAGEDFYLGTAVTHSEISFHYEGSERARASASRSTDHINLFLLCCPGYSIEETWSVPYPPTDKDKEIQMLDWHMENWIMKPNHFSLELAYAARLMRQRYIELGVDITRLKPVPWPPRTASWVFDMGVPWPSNTTRTHFFGETEPTEIQGLSLQQGT